MQDYPFVVSFPVHWGELDALGHVNNSRYFTWFETARMHLFERLGLESTGSPEVGPILAHTGCDFLAPVTFPSEVRVGTRIARVGTTSFTMEYAVALAETPEEPVARGTGVIVLVSYRSGEKVPIPDDLRVALEELRG